MSFFDYYNQSKYDLVLIPGRFGYSLTMLSTSREVIIEVVDVLSGSVVTSESFPTSNLIPACSYFHRTQRRLM